MLTSLTALTTLGVCSSNDRNYISFLSEALTKFSSMYIYYSSVRESEKEREREQN